MIVGSNCIWCFFADMAAHVLKKKVTYFYIEARSSQAQDDWLIIKAEICVVEQQTQDKDQRRGINCKHINEG